MTTNEKSLQDIDQQISRVAPAQIELYTAAQGLKAMFSTIAAPALDHLLWQAQDNHCDPEAYAHKMEALWIRGGGRDVDKLVRVHCALAAVEAADGYAEAAAILEPLCARRAELRALVAAEAAALAQALSDAEEAHAAAIARATEAAANDPAVRLAAERVAALSNPQAPAPTPPLTRGKIKLPCPAEEMTADLH
jgi:hypothetical protein